MTGLMFAQIPLSVAWLAMLGVLVASVELGYRLGMHRLRKGLEDRKSAEMIRSDVTLGAMLALLGLILAFTFAFELSRSDARKQVLIKEANAIGTAYLRADLFAEPARSSLKSVLYEYTKTRVVGDVDLTSLASIRDAIDRSTAEQARIWPTLLAALGGDEPAPLQAAMVTAVNEVLDVHTERIALIYDRMPPTVFLLLVMIALLSLGSSAYNAGLHERMSRARMYTFALILATLIAVIIDFEQPYSGTIRFDYHAVEALLADMAAEMGR